MGLTTKILANERLGSTWRSLANYLKGHRLAAPPIFVVGCDHSGTSVLLKCLDMHSSIYGVPYESRAFYKSSGKIRMAQWFWEKDTLAAGKRRWAEKTPGHIEYLDRVLTHFPDARIVLIIRDGRDVAVSLRNRHGCLEKGIRRWMQANLAAEPFWSHPQLCKIHYEDFVGDFERTMRGVCDFLGEPYQEQMARIDRKRTNWYATNDERPASEAEGRDHAELRNWQINQPLYNGSGKWMREMSPEEKEIFKQLAGAMLIRYGYAADSTW